MRVRTAVTAFLFQAALIGAQGIKVEDIESTYTLDGNVIYIDAADDGTGGFQEDRRLRCRDNTVPRLTSDKKHVACCLNGQNLVGNKKIGFECCAEGHDRVGTAATGYRCCPTGQTFDGQVCKEKEKVEKSCANGKILVNGECACPPGTKEMEDGTCEKEECSSGLETGKAHPFMFQDHPS
jgi:hypothetical protein